MGSIVIVGAGLAGGTAARTLREEGHEGPITLIGTEPHPPYNRPPLSKDLLAGAAQRDSVFVATREWYAENGIELLTGETVVALDPDAHEVRLESGRALHYDQALLATGSAPRRLTIPGAELAGVHHLRTLDDSEALHAELAGGGRRLAVIGSGWIGMEVAATATRLGNAVTVLTLDEVPLGRVLGAELGEYVTGLHLAQGVVVRRSVSVQAIEGRDGRVTGVVLEGGEVVPADAVVAGIGAVPLTDLASAAGLAVDNGVLVDAALRTSAPNVFAAGDIASVLHPVTGMRVRSEHWSNARAGGAAAARSMLGQDVSYDDIPAFLTKQYDASMGYSGFPITDDGTEVVYRGDPAVGEFIGFRVAGGVPVGALAVNMRGVSTPIAALLRRGTPVDVARLADTETPLEGL
jgi:3-phenylpropionate/trans-cinnamate dioxygenase ferredoxin reductase subunit